MKLLGYERVHGEKYGKKYDFMKLYLCENEVSPSADAGGYIPHIFFSSSRGNYLPTVDTSVFLDALKKGVSIGSDVVYHRTLDGKNTLELA